MLPFRFRMTVTGINSLSARSSAKSLDKIQAFWVTEYAMGTTTGLSVYLNAERTGIYVKNHSNGGAAKSHQIYTIPRSNHDPIRNASGLSALPFQQPKETS
jgi:hypothetical protein